MAAFGVVAVALVLFAVPVSSAGRSCGLPVTAYWGNLDVDGPTSGCVSAGGWRLLATAFALVVALAVLALSRRLGATGPVAEARSVRRAAALSVGAVTVLSLGYASVPAGRSDGVVSGPSRTVIQAPEDCGPAIVHGWALRPLDSPRTCAGIAGSRLARSLLAVVASMSVSALVGLLLLTDDRARPAVPVGWAVVLAAGVLWTVVGARFPFGAVWNGGGDGVARASVAGGGALTVGGALAGFVGARRDERDRAATRAAGAR
jgi:hypothetical protein